MDKHANSFCRILAIVALFAIGCNGPTDTSAPKQTVIAMLPKLTNIAYFDACHRGAEKAAQELGVRLIYDGPREPSGSEQNKFIESWIRQGVDAICVAPNQPKSIKTFVRRAQQRGIKVLTWDSDAPDSGRDLMVNQVDDQQLGHLLIDDIAQQMQEKGEWAIAIASLDAANLNTWRKHAEQRAEEKYPNMKLVEVVVTNEDENVARSKVETLLNVHPNLKGIIAFDSNSVPGAAEALKRTNKWKQVALTGNTSPQKMRPYLKQGVLKSFYLWDPRELGDLTIRLAVALVRDENITAGQTIAHHRPLEFSKQDPKMVILSQPIRFTAENIDQYDWGF